MYADGSHHPEHEGALPPLNPNSDAFPTDLDAADPSRRDGQTGMDGAAVGWLLKLLARGSGTIGGLVTVLGGVIAAVVRRPLPTPVLPLGEALRRAAALRPSGLLELGTLLLIASPFLYLLERLRRRHDQGGADERR